MAVGQLFSLGATAGGRRAMRFSDYRLTLLAMHAIVVLGIRLLEVMFAIGAIGSAIVLILSGIEDIETLFGSDDSAHH